MSKISPQVREQVRAANDIVEVIGTYMPLKRAGNSYAALCPFHKEKTPSFHVNPARQTFHCFGCNKGGDVFQFVQDYENISFFEALKRLADRVGIALETDESPRQTEDRALRDQLRELHEQIAQYWQQALEQEETGRVARDYLVSRGVPGEASKLFRLGFAPEAWDDTVQWAQRRKWDLQLVEKAGLIIQREPGNPSRGFYDRFRGRLIFPINDEQGRVIGFSGRLLKQAEKAPKYVNSPETLIFTKGRVLYGLDKTKRAILDAGSVVICEGQLDLIACYMAGVQNIVAPQGTALTGEHLRVLRRYAQEAVLCFDSDAAGQKAAARVLDDLLASGLALRVISIPSPHDPDTYIRAHGPEAFRQLAAGAQDFFEFYLGFLCRQHNVATDGGRLAVLEAMGAALERAGNEVLMDRYAQRTAMVLAAGGGIALSANAVRVEFRRRGRKPEYPPRASEAPVASEEPVKEFIPPGATENWLLKLLFLNDEFAGWLALHLTPSWIRHEGVRELVNHILQLHQAGEWHGPAGFLSGIDDGSLRSLASRAMADGRTIPNPEQQLADVVTRLRNTWIDQEMTRLTVQAEQPQIEDAERLSLLHQLQHLRRSRREPLTARSLDAD